ncbi:MAG: FHA domain-containing protein, partial [Clostridia bacterium]|nr:FHA domain-containing protein [Clostridia bacterium]
MSLELITAIGRWLLPVLAALIVVSCGGVLVRGNRKTGTIGYVVNAANGDSMALRQFETSIGRSKLCDIVLNYNTVSRFHAVIARRGGKWILFDTNSKTGTYVNKDRVVEKKYLENGDTLIFGNAMFKFYEELPE